MAHLPDKQIIYLLKELPTKKDLVVLKSEIFDELDKRFGKQDKRIDQKFGQQEKKFNQKFTEQDKKLDQKLIKLREDINNDIRTTIMPMLYNHDERLDRIDKHLGLPPLPIRL